MKKIAFTGGGTGGHIYPGIAIADELRLKFARENPGEDFELVWIGNCAGMDKSIVEKSIGPDGKPSVDRFYGIPSGKFRRNFDLKNFIDIFKILAGIVASFFILLRLKPQLLFSKGGFVSVPPCLCAKILGIPVFTHECDFTPGLATRINSRSASKILISYQETRRFFSEKKQDNLVLTGNPVRPVFYQADREKGFEFLGIKKENLSKPVLMVLGGSSGSTQINKLVAQNIEWLTRHFFVVHQTGMYQDASISLENLSDDVKSCYRPYKFIYEQMPDVIACADIVLSRAGANSLWECAVLKKPMILIPLCGRATRGDQVDNAAYFQRNGAAITLNGSDVDSDHLKDSLKIMAQEQKLQECSAACGKILPAEKPAVIISNLLYNSLM